MPRSNAGAAEVLSIDAQRSPRPTQLELRARATTNTPARYHAASPGPAIAHQVRAHIIRPPSGPDVHSSLAGRSLTSFEMALKLGLVESLSSSNRRLSEVVCR